MSGNKHTQYSILLFLVVTYVCSPLFGYHGNATNIGGTEDERRPYIHGNILDPCNISEVHFDQQNPEFVIMETSWTISPNICTVNITAPPGIPIVLSILDASSNDTLPSYLYVEKFGVCSNAACNDRFTSLPQNQTNCYIPFNHSQIAINIQRDVQLEVATWPAFDLDSQNHEVRLSRCRDVWHYRNIIKNTDLSHYGRKKCPQDCHQNCTCSLGQSEIITICPDNTTYKSFIIHPNTTRYLYLNNCGLHTIRSNAFSGLGVLNKLLELSFNQISHLPDNVFAGLSELQYLYLDHNQIPSLPADVFAELSELQILYLGYNQISHLSANAFAGLSELQQLYIANNQIQSLSANALTGLGELQYLILDHNQIPRLSANAFAGLSELSYLQLDNNQISKLSANAFAGLSELQYLSLHYNQISHLPANAFAGLSELQYFRLDHNQIPRLSAIVFADLSVLQYLFLKYNELTQLSANAFAGLSMLFNLNLEHNQITNLSGKLLISNIKLGQLYLNHNKLTHIPAIAFSSLRNLTILHLQNNHINYLPAGLFRNNINLVFLNISSNDINMIASHMFQSCTQLSFVHLSNNPLQWVNKRSFLGLTATVFVENYDTCCFIETQICYSKQTRSPFLTCDRLLSFSFQRVAMWILGIGAIVGNVGAICSRYRQMTRTLTVQLLIIVNLSISDLFMGIYLLILTSVDLFYTEYFPSHSDEWRNSIVCKVAGTFAVLSSEASVFFITLLSIDRYLGIKYPFSARRLDSKSAKIVIMIMWTVALGISICTFSLSNLGSNASYGVPEVCVSLPISRNLIYETQNLNITYNSSYFVFNRWWTQMYTINYTNTNEIGSEASMFFSVAIFTGLNLVCFLIVTFCYLSIFIEVRRSASQTGRSRNARQEIRMAKKMSAIVITDLCCWMPIIILSILVQSKVVTINPVAYVWIATFVLPINSMLNPFLYTLATALSNWHEKRNQSESAGETMATLTHENVTSDSQNK